MSRRCCYCNTDISKPGSTVFINEQWYCRSCNYPTNKKKSIFQRFLDLLEGEPTEFAKFAGYGKNVEAHNGRK